MRLTRCSSMKRTYFLIVTAISEGITGVLLLVIPTLFLPLLLGENALTPETTIYARILGATLIVLSIAWWNVRNAHGKPAQRALLIVALIYDIAAAIALAYLGLAKNMAGILLWPAILAHI